LLQKKPIDCLLTKGRHEVSSVAAGTPFLLASMGYPSVSMKRMLTTFAAKHALHSALYQASPIFIHGA